MPIKIKKGCILEAALSEEKGRPEIIAHGCNCRNAYGAGLALSIAKKFPKAKNKYHEKFNDYGWRLGEVQFVDVSSSEKHPLIIANCATQNLYGSCHDRYCYANYEAIETTMKIVRDFANGREIGIPKIGAGLAGGDWNRIYEILAKVFKDNNNITLYVL